MTIVEFLPPEDAEVFSLRCTSSDPKQACNSDTVLWVGPVHEGVLYKVDLSAGCQMHLRGTTDWKIYYPLLDMTLPSGRPCPVQLYIPEEFVPQGIIAQA